MLAAIVSIVPSARTAPQREQAQGVGMEHIVSASIAAALAVTMAGSLNGCERKRGAVREGCIATDF
jgi:hypothetical protein